MPNGCFKKANTNNGPGVGYGVRFDPLKTFLAWRKAFSGACSRVLDLSLKP